jgi:hypothetical protein
MSDPQLYAAPYPQPPAQGEFAGEADGVPEPPVRVPFAVMLATLLLGVLAAALASGMLSLITSISVLSRFDGDNDGSMARYLGVGAAMAAIGVAAACIGAAAWALVRNGAIIGAMVVGGLVTVLGAIVFVSDATSTSQSAGTAISVLAVVFGALIVVLPLLGDAPRYLAGRRAWSKAESRWLRRAGAPAAPQWPVAQQWPGQQQAAPQQQAGPQQQPPWGGAPQQWNAPPPQSAPPQQQPWSGPQGQ